ncbi:TetR family transcriptional regulator [Neorhizobium sp. SOG26]|nr:TetR family transcriptional regulator [Neorhizobium sp. SOG26]
MSQAHRREKQPEQVRRSILDQAARSAAEAGLSAITLQSVAASATVTKGGLLHHFSSKQALVEAVFADLLAKLDDEIDRLIENDTASPGRFTRAYIEAFFQVTREGAGSPWAALSVSCMNDPKLRALWSDWMRGRIERHADTDNHPVLQIARYAADGIWLANLMENNGVEPQDLERLRMELRKMTEIEAPR